MKINALAAKTPKGFLEPFVYEREIKPSDVLISIKYCSMTRGDVCFIDNFWGDTNYPLVPGSEIFGIVKEKGKEVKDLEIGDYVGVGYQMTSCSNCEYCKQGKEQFCKQQKVLSVNGFGGLADYIVFDSRFTFKIPNKLQTAAHVPLMCSGLTPYSAIKRVDVEPGMKVGLVGVGNLGHMALQILNKLGCKVTVFSHSKNKEGILRELGAQDFIDSTDKKALEKEEKNYDVILSTSSGTLDWESYIKMLTPQGTICFVGLPPDNISFPATLLADYAQRRVQGSYIGSRAETKELLDFTEKNDIKATAEVYPMSEANNVVSKIRNKGIKFSVVLENK